MPQGYMFLGSEDEEFNKRFTLDHFELAPKEEKSFFSGYEECMSIINNPIENITDEQRERWATHQRTGKIGSKELVYAVAHCVLCKKAHINNSFRYCMPCEFYIHKWDKDVRE